MGFEFGSEMGWVMIRGNGDLRDPLLVVELRRLSVRVRKGAIA